MRMKLILLASCILATCTGCSNGTPTQPKTAGTLAVSATFSEIWGNGRFKDFVGTDGSFVISYASDFEETTSEWPNGVKAREIVIDTPRVEYLGEQVRAHEVSSFMDGGIGYFVFTYDGDQFQLRGFMSRYRDGRRYQLNFHGEYAGRLDRDGYPVFESLNATLTRETISYFIDGEAHSSITAVTGDLRLRHWP